MIIRPVLFAASLAAGLGSVTAAAQFPEESRRRPEPVFMAVNQPYDGSFEFVRIRFGQSLGRGFGRGGPLWAHDYPRAEANFTKILSEVSTISTRTQASAVIALDDPLLFQHAVAYVVEVGGWDPTSAEIKALRTWLERGGFLIVDDFARNDIYNFEARIKEVLPWARLIPIPREHPVFDSFYHFTDFEAVRHPYSGDQTSFVGIFENNDPSGRLMVAANYNGDIAEYWEFADVGFAPVALTNDAFKLGVNYIVYALTR